MRIATSLHQPDTGWPLNEVSQLTMKFCATFTLLIALLCSQLWTDDVAQAAAVQSPVQSPSQSTRQAVLQQLDINPMYIYQVWHDADSDGVMDADEQGIEGVTVALYRAGQTPEVDAPKAVRVTDVEGKYAFGKLTGGDYFVYAYAPDIYPVSSQIENGSGFIQLNGSGSPVQGPPITIADDQPIGHNLGFYTFVSVGDRVWYDNDRDGRYEPEDGEIGVADVVVELFKTTADSASLMATSLGTSLGTTTTDVAGLYKFKNLMPGSYYVLFHTSSLPSGYQITIQGAAGVEDTLDSDANPNEPNRGSTLTTPFLTSGQAYTALDMGVYAQASVGDRVWEDNDQDGLYEPQEGESGVAGVSVVLYDAETEQPVLDESGNGMVTVTDSHGRYLFTQLAPGNYYIQFSLDSLPAGYQITTADVGDNDSVDSDANPETGRTHETGLLSFEDSHTGLDMGIYTILASLGDRVWHDLDRDGYQDPSEPGVQGVEVAIYYALTDAPVVDEAGEPRVEITDEFGKYHFMDLMPDNYYVIFNTSSLPVGYQVTVPKSGVDNAVDSDADPVTGKTGPTHLLIEGEAALTLDMGIWTPVTVGDRVWEDANGNGLQDAGEPGVADVRVSLYDAATDQPVTDEEGLLQSQQSDTEGRYLFENLLPGDYYLQFDLSGLTESYVVTTQHAESQAGQASQESGAIDSDVDPQTMRTTDTGFIVSGGQVHGLAMGLWIPTQVSGQVWHDENQDGVQGDNEPGVPDIFVMLFDAVTNLPVTDENQNSLSQVTDENGAYLFDNLRPGEYFIAFDTDAIPEGYSITTPSVGDNEETDSDANPSNGHTGSTGFISSGNDALNQDLGLSEQGEIRIGDLVWEDVNGNGLQDTGEKGVAGVTVTLHDASTDAVVVNIDGQPFTQVTDDNGNYLFTGVPIGNYYVIFALDGAMQVYTVTKQDVHENSLDQQDSDTDPTTGQSASTGMLADREEKLSLDMGVYQPIILGNYIWNDRNADGTQDPGEHGLEEVTVKLYDASGLEISAEVQAENTTATLATVVLAETVSDMQGFYRFTDLAPGTYQVEIVAPEGYGFSQVNQGNSDELDSDVDPTTGRKTITLRSGQAESKIDVGLHESSFLGNRVWRDDNGDGIQDEAEIGLADVTVRLYDSVDTLVSSTTTDSDGLYGFSSLNPNGIYYMEFIPPAGHIPSPPNRGDDDAVDSDIDGVTSTTPKTVLTAGETDSSWDAGFMQEASISGYVWYDANKNGIRDENESGLSGVKVHLRDDDGRPVGVTSTNTEGHFEFTRLRAEDFYMDVTPPAGFLFTEPNLGDSEVSDSDIDPATGTTVVRASRPGEDAPLWAAGLIASPTAVELLSFEATEEKGAIDLNWVTGDEVNTWGFHLYRSTDGSFENAALITLELLPSLSSDIQNQAPYRYTFSDSSVLPNLPYSYWLVEVENGGHSNVYGPTRAMVRDAGAGDAPTTAVDSTDNLAMNEAIFLPLVMR